MAILDPQQTPDIIDRILNFVAIDTETTGLNSEKDEIIELAAIRYRNGVVCDRFNTFVKPVKAPPNFIKHLTHIEPESLNRAPSISKVIKDFQTFIGEDIIVGQNTPFDLGFVNSALIRNGHLPLTNKYWDTAEISRIYFPFVGDHKLNTMTDFMGVKLENAHRAIDDAEATGNLMIAMSQYILKHFSLILNARILDLSRQAKLSSSLEEYLVLLVDFQRKNALLAGKTTLPNNPYFNIIENKSEARYPTLVEVFDNDGIFAKRFSNYELRQGQLDMAESVLEAQRDNEFLLVEAGTGVGKSFAYLVPSLINASQKGIKVVVSTNTKNLQEQLFFKDLPMLKDLLPIPFLAVLVKGRENYICERKWLELLDEQKHGFSAYDANALLHLLIWKTLTRTGDVSENTSFDKGRFATTWRRICSERYTCHNRKCQFYGSCYTMKLRKIIDTASVVVVNHSLLLSDLKAENATLGEYSHLVIDEAHNLMSTASSTLGFELSYSDTAILINQLISSHKRKNTGLLGQIETAIAKSIVSKGAKDQVKNLCSQLSEVADKAKKPLLDLFNSAVGFTQLPDSYGKHRIKDTDRYPDLFDRLGAVIHSWKAIIKELQALMNVMGTLNAKTVIGYDVINESLEAFQMRSMEVESKLLALQNPDLNKDTLWLESINTSDRNNPGVSFCYAPIEVSEHLCNMLYKMVPSIVFTTATLALRGSFKYYLSQSGLSLLKDKQCRQVVVDSPFDYRTQTRLAISSFLPEHKDKFFLSQALGCIEQLLLSTNVGTMLLFTSYKDLNTVYDHIGEMLYQKQRPFFAQGKGGSRSAILSEFKKHNNAVLLGTSSFWEGVDIQGESLSLLILYKIPFQVPSEPLVEAYIDKLEREEQDSFMHYMLPNALLKLRQGFGRLIRSKSDRGVVLIMDSRVSKKKYGDYFKQVLPAQSIEYRNELELVSDISAFFHRRNS